MVGDYFFIQGSVLYAQNTTDKKEKADAMFQHKSFGLLAAGLLVPRLLARFASKSPGPVIGASAIENVGGNISHLVMYAFAIVLPVTGVVMGSFSGFGLPFFYTTFPSIRKEPAIAKQAYEIHKLVGQAFEYFIPVHVGGAFYHVFRGHKVFARIAGIGNSASKAVK